ncbi:MAG TPA: DUF167 domain-containing protein [Parcubacteria group bacterium]|jgi:uncharacterized protein YggU (UPF0235/DUF167 family)|nr:DUF167 domain-containing protein [Parcubacteria group bacterium]
MRITVKAKPNSKKSMVIKAMQTPLPFVQQEQDTYFVYTTEPPIDGKANKAVTELLADYFDVSKSQVVLVSGLTNKNKIFDIVI